MKILTKEEEREHYNETLKGGTIAGLGGLGVGALGVWAASSRYHFFRTLTLPLKAFLVTSTGTFTGIIGADHWSRKYEQQRNPLDREYHEREEARKQAEKASQTFTQRAMEFGRRERYKIVAGSWVASIAAAFAIVNRDKYLTGQQKIVQARVYAQFLTLGVLIASAAFEISDQRKEQGRWETVKYVDPNDPEHKRILEKQVEVDSSSAGGERKEDRGGRDLWKDMVSAEEERIKEREEDEARFKKHAEKKHNGKKNKKESSKDDSTDEKKSANDDGKEEGKGDKKADKDGKEDDSKEKKNK